MTIGIKAMGRSLPLRSEVPSAVVSGAGPGSVVSPGRGPRRRPPCPSVSGARGGLVRFGRGDVAHHLVHQAVLLGLQRREVAVALGVLADPLDRLAGVLGEDLVDDLPALEDL